MKLDLDSLTFRNRIQSGGGTPSWGTAIGQGEGHKINVDKEGIDNILRGLVYCGVRDDNIRFAAGKGGGEGDHKLIRLSAIFTKIKIEAYLPWAEENQFRVFPIEGIKFILLLTVDDSQSHKGRLRLKYAPKTSYTAEDGTTYTNQEVYDAIENTLNIKDKGCWFVSHLDIENQDTIKLRVIVVNKEGPEVYSSAKERCSIWEKLITSYSERINMVKGGDNIIFYGMPGCGKSHTIKEQYCDDEQYMERVVFHPDYTYSDFIGQILPQLVDGHISYSFVPGPFTRILKKAHYDPYNKYYLIIEEINRGNAAAIFGDVFQLLDRKNGESEYGISNAEIANAVYEDSKPLVKIPANLTIIATMNTVDQNVFTLDTAFKRRWRMKSVSSDIDNCHLATLKIAGTDITWKQFVNAINELIVEISNGNIGVEDKRLGAYFVKEEELQDLEQFSSKVLLYLWNDVFKHERNIIFKPEYKTLDNVIADFCGGKNISVFSNEVLKRFDRLYVESSDI